MPEKIILASQSPRRKQLLEWAEVNFDVIVKPTDESYPEGLDLEEVPVFIARNKALAIQQDNRYLHFEEGNAILSADTIVVLENQVIGKPENRTHAINTLISLSGKEHKVITGVVIRKGQHEVSFSETTFVKFHELSLEQIEFYIDKYQPYDKAGAYAIQEWIGVIGIEYIKGDFYNVMGLPVSKVVKYIQEF